MPDPHAIVDAYLAVWNETDPARRRELIARTWTDDARYLDPLMSGDGPAGIDAMVAGAQAQFPGARFEPEGAPDQHHDRLRFSWHLRAADGSAIATGTDFATVAADGRLRDVTGFLEPAA